MKKRILNNWTLKLASLFLAALLWFVVVQFNDPKDTKTLNNIRVNLINQELLENENKVYEVLDDTDIVSVTVRAPKSVIGQLRSGDVVAEADVSRLTDINTIPITYNLQNVNADYSIEGNHDVIRLNVEDKASKMVRVIYNTIGEVADGYMISKVDPDPTALEVSGPRSIIEKISYAAVEIDVTGFNTNMSAYVDISFYDADDNLLEAKNIQKRVNYVRMSVEVLAVKEVPIEVNYMGIPESGYMATGEVWCDPETVKIAGTPTNLAGVTKISIPEERLNITGANEDLTDIVNIKEYLPENVKFADSSFQGKVTATVAIEPVKEKTLELTEGDIQLINVPEGFEASLSETSYHLEITGRDADIAGINRVRLNPRVDVEAWMEEEGIEELTEATHSIPVTLNLPDGVKVKQNITVRINFQKTDENDQ
ncbi:MAG: hypothetical protein K6G30_14580 [Acetatifactor sp.]|nr:hypothetical protein [Acetatifactor sp.]